MGRPRRSSAVGGTEGPSSESMTHGVVYDAAPAIRFVFHGHSSAIWEQARTLGLLATDPAAGYGTPAMCWKVQRLLRDPEVARGPVLVMSGHQDGVLAFGETAGEAGGALVDLLSRALCLDAAGVAGSTWVDLLLFSMRSPA